jgi:hypothetical protein
MYHQSNRIWINWEYLKFGYEFFCWRVEGEGKGGWGAEVRQFPIGRRGVGDQVQKEERMQIWGVGATELNELVVGHVVKQSLTLRKSLLSISVPVTSSFRLVVTIGCYFPAEIIDHPHSLGVPKMSFQPSTHFGAVGIVLEELVRFPKVFSTGVRQRGWGLVRGRLQKGDLTDTRWDAVSESRLRGIIKKMRLGSLLIDIYIYILCIHNILFYFLYNYFNHLYNLPIMWHSSSSHMFR